jgi:hypothetical protein
MDGGCCCTGIPCGGMPGNCWFTGVTICGGICTLIGSSSSGCGGRWNVGGGATAVVTCAGARVVDMKMVMRSYIAAFATGDVRGAAM